MAHIAVFEDDPYAYSVVSAALEPSRHEIVGAASSTLEAIVLLRRMALGEVQADYSLVDGRLTRGNPDNYHYPAFEFTPPGAELPAQPSRKWYHKREKPVVNPSEIIVEHEGNELGADGRFILRVIQAAGIETTTINLSVDWAHTWDHDQLIDYELTKNHSRFIADVIDKLEANKKS